MCKPFYLYCSSFFMKWNESLTCLTTFLTSKTVFFLPFPIAWKNGWQIISPKKSFAVFAASPTEKAEWMAHINKCIAELLAKSELKLPTHAKN